MGQEAGLTVRFVLTEWQLVDRRNLEIIRYVVTGQRLVSMYHWRVVEEKSNAAVIIDHVNGFRIRVSALDEQAACKAPIDGDLERGVMGTEPAVLKQRGNFAAKRC